MMFENECRQPQPGPSEDSSLAAGTALGAGLSPAFELSCAIGWGIALGDALGLPYETMTRAQILEIPEWHVGFGDPLRNELLGAIRETGVVKPAITSDDLLFSVAVAEGLISAGGYSIEALESTHLALLHNALRIGWGGQVLGALERLDRGEPREAAGALLGTRTGDGALMKIGYLALYQEWCGVSGDEQLRQIESFSAMTHRSTAAVQAGLAYVELFRTCLRMGADSLDTDEVLDRVIAAAERGAQSFSAAPEDKPVVERLRQIPAQAGRSSPEALLSALGIPDSKVFNCLPMVVAMTLYAIDNRLSPHQAIIETIGVGGDTDSTAALVGGCMGALHRSREAFPADLVLQIPDIQAVMDTARRFSDTFAPEHLK